MPADPTVQPAADAVAELPADEATTAVAVEAEPVAEPAGSEVPPAGQ